MEEPVRNEPTQGRDLAFSGPYIEKSSTGVATLVQKQADKSKVEPVELIPREKLEKLSRKARKNTKTTLDKWFDMPGIFCKYTLTIHLAPEITPELERDLQIIRNRSALDPKRHYKRDDSSKKMPKYFQMGTIIGGSTDHYNRLDRKKRRSTIAEELLGDGLKSSYLKTKYDKIQRKKAYSAPPWLKKKLMDKKKRRNN